MRLIRSAFLFAAERPTIWRSLASERKSRTVIAARKAGVKIFTAILYNGIKIAVQRSVDSREPPIIGGGDSYLPNRSTDAPTV